MDVTPIKQRRSAILHEAEPLKYKAPQIGQDLFNKTVNSPPLLIVTWLF